MILKGYIKKLPDQGDNIFKVRIPFLEDNTNSEMVFDALLCNQPGIYYGYKVGDCVFVSFENDKLDTPIILGKLFINVKDKDDGSATYHLVNELTVTDTINLPENTKIGNYSAADFFKLYQKINNVVSDLNAGNLSGGSGGGSGSSAVTGVKGSEESVYRTGNVNISKGDIGVTSISSDEINTIVNS